MNDYGPIFFFHESDPQWGWLSQWYPSPFTIKQRDQKDKEIEIRYLHAEQYMMHHKALTFSDYKTAKEVLLNPSPRDAKRLGQQIRHFSAEKWDEVKFEVVTQGSYLKYTKCDESQPGLDSDDPEMRKTLKQKLLETGERELVEASHFDKVWGVGFSPEQCRAMLKEKGGEGRKRWGQNLLGKALMAARERIRREEEQMERERERDRD